MIRRIGLAVVVACVGALAAAASGASAASTIGQTFTPTTGSTCAGSPDFEVVQTHTASGASYVAQSPGVLTSWSFQSATSSQSVLTMRAYRPTSTAHRWRVIADAGPLQTISASSGLHTFPTRISVDEGDTVGIRSTAGTCGTSTGNAGDIYEFGPAGPSTPVGEEGTFTLSSGFIWDIAASLEADADHDGYGDETQDGCPTNSEVHSACPSPHKKKCKKAKHHEASAAKKKCRKKHKR
jgi:hypothetical protein